MRVVHVHELPVVVRIDTPRGVIVAVPGRLDHHKVLDLASLVLSDDEYAGLARELAAVPTVR
jgi:hypothetical protein